MGGVAAATAMSAIGRDRLRVLTDLWTAGHWRSKGIYHRRGGKQKA